MVEAPKHAPFNASSAERRALCPGSWRLEQSMPPSNSTYADGGKLAHEVLEGHLVSRTKIVKSAGVSEDVAVAVQVVLDYVYGIMMRNSDAVLYVEQKVQFPSKAAPGDVWGTLDIGIYIPSLCRLYIIDYKHGAGVFVDIFENRQLLQYEASFEHTFNLAVAEATLVIVQPRVFGPDPIREWTVDMFDLATWRGRLEAEIIAAQAPDAPFNPGEKQCRFCRAKPVCPELERRALAATHHAFRNVKDVSLNLPAPRELDVQRLSDVVKAKSLILDWLSAVEEYATEQAQNGVTIPECKLVQGVARRVFTAEPVEITQAIRAIDPPFRDDFEDRVQPRKMAGLGDIEKYVAEVYAAKYPGEDRKLLKGKVTGFMDSITAKKPSNTVSLVPVSDKRPEVRKVSDVFASVVHVPVAQG